MAPRRAAVARRLTPPSVPIFAVSLIVALIAVASFYTRIPVIGPFVDAHRFAVLAAAYVVLVLGVLFRGI